MTTIELAQAHLEANTPRDAVINAARALTVSQ